MLRDLLPRLPVLIAALLSACVPSADDGGTELAASDLRELRVVTSGGFSAAYDALAPGFEADTGIALTTAYGSSSGGAPDSIPVRLERGEEYDVIIMSRSGLDRLAELGHVRPETRRDLVRSVIGMAVRKGAPVPDISTPQLFVEALRQAETIGYSASVSGTYLSQDLWPRIGLWEELEPKSRRILSERVAAVVARGDVEIGFQQVSEILRVDGAVLVGPIPDEYQKITRFSAGIGTSTRSAADAQLLIDYLSSAEVVTTIAATGLEPVAAGR